VELGESSVRIREPDSAQRAVDAGVQSRSGRSTRSVVVQATQSVGDGGDAFASMEVSETDEGIGLSFSYFF